VRIVAATNRDLAEMVAAGTFREDLFFRLNVFPLMIPPLRERGGDIIALAEHFMARFAAEAEKRVARITTPALGLLMAHDWPGNVRELENAIERAVILTEDDAVHSYNLPPQLQSPVAEGEAPRLDLDARLAVIEREMLDEALARHQGNASRAAQALGLTYRSMGIRMRRHGLRYGDYRNQRK
jgi:Nif-specific regulatory protein